MKIQFLGWLPLLTEFLKNAWRPVVGGNLVGWYIFASFTNPVAADLLQIPAASVLAFYFLERAMMHARNESPSPVRDESGSNAP